jgi:hypothetical protein
VILLACRYADTQIRRWCSGLLAIDACLLVKIVFLLSRMSTKIDSCGATGHDHGGWQVAAAAVTETTSTPEAAAVGRRRHRQWRRRKHTHRVIVDGGNNTTTTITMTMTATVTTTTVRRWLAVGSGGVKTEPAAEAAVSMAGETTINKEQ